jgi:hypothetical protein
MGSIMVTEIVLIKAVRALYETTKLYLREKFIGMFLG